MYNKNISTVEEYIKQFPLPVQEILTRLCEVVHKAAPEVTETISYGMPTFKLKGKTLLHFAAYNKHIGFYPTPSGVSAFEAKLKGYKTSKGAVQFPLVKPVPYNLITGITKFRVREVLEKTS